MSLRDLNLGFVDLYMIQFPIGFQYVDEYEMIPLEESGKVNLDNKIHLEAVWKAMEHEVRVGRAKSIGVSNFNEAQLERLLKSCTIQPAVLQVCLSRPILLGLSNRFAHKFYPIFYSVLN
jgi:diketogulonate reductase-like aldo/keto reductase